jgi:hypothetical protein
MSRQATPAPNIIAPLGSLSGSLYGMVTMRPFRPPILSSQATHSGPLTGRGSEYAPQSNVSETLESADRNIRTTVSIPWIFTSRKPGGSLNLKCLSWTGSQDFMSSFGLAQGGIVRSLPPPRPHPTEVVTATSRVMPMRKCVPLSEGPNFFISVQATRYGTPSEGMVLQSAQNCSGSPHWRPHWRAELGP